jgi:deazaflavin-dependent oxidoreductase (nitroreductase family)
MTTSLPDIDPSLPRTDPAAMNEFNQLLITEFRARRGQLSGQLTGAPILLLTTVGAKTGKTRTTPLGYICDHGRYIVAASKAGAATNPDWYHNLTARPAATVETGTATLAVRSSVAHGEQRSRLFQRLAEQWPMQLDYQRQTTRQIPVVVLEPLPQAPTAQACQPRSG